MSARTMEPGSKEGQTYKSQTKVYDCIIIGTGFSGICMGIRLQKLGIQSFLILEKAEGVGGTWRDNTYPGAECDVQSHLYSFSFEPNPNWKKMFGEQKEILDYLNFCTDKYNLRDHIKFHTRVKGIYYKEETGIWEIKTQNSEVYFARTIVSGNGGLSIPSIPNFPGLENFKGKFFHSARWDHDYELKGKKVAVIGTGASAIQIVPAIAPLVETLNLFQRSPAWVIPKPDRKISELESQMFKLFPGTQVFMREWIYWTLEMRAILFVLFPEILKILEPYARTFIDKVIKDPELRKKVTPNYTIGCKRVLLSNDYYPALTRNNVNVISSSIQEIKESSILTKDGMEHRVDTIIAATGFQVAESGIPFEVLGRNNEDLNNIWKMKGASAYLGSTVHGFPNLFLMTGPNTGLGHNSMVYMIESQAEYIANCIQLLKKKNLKSMEIKFEVQDLYNRQLQDRMKKTVWAEDCGSWYVDKQGRNSTLWPGFTFEFKFKTMFLNQADFEIIKEKEMFFEKNK